RHPLGVPAARVRRLHLRVDQGEPVVVDAADAYSLRLFGDRVRHRAGHADVHRAVDFSLEMVDLIHRIYEADESFHALDFMVHTRLFVSQIVLQLLLGTGLYVLAGYLTLVGIFAMRWNVVIGGQLFSKSFLGYTTYEMQLGTREALLPAIVL